MRCKETGKKLITTRVAPLLLVLLSISLQSLAQTNAEDRQSPPATTKETNKPEDLSKWPGLLLAFEGGSGWSVPPNSSPTGYAGFKIGGPGMTLDFGYDRVLSHSGFSIEGSAMLPVLRFPRPQADDKKNFLRIYAEPGVGYRVGRGLSSYASVKAMMVLFSDYRLTSSAMKWSPFVEFQHRFALLPGERSDTRVTIGMMWALCEHCGLD